MTVEASVKATEFRFVLNRAAAEHLHGLLYRSGTTPDLNNLRESLKALLDLPDEVR